MPSPTGSGTPPARRAGERGPAGAAPVWAVLSYGFRPFFLAAGLYAIVAIATWMWMLARSISPLAALPPSLWHGHEMVFGFAAAAVGGFLLTAVPSWTGARGFAGLPLALAVALWLAGRIAFAPGIALPMRWVAALELAYLPGLALLLAPPLLRERNRNTPLLLVLLALWLGDAVFLCAMARGEGPLASGALRFAIGFLLVLVTVIGGRIVPAFTINALRRRGITDPRVRGSALLDGFAIAAMVALALANAAPSATALIAPIGAAAAALQLWRLSRWQDARAWREPIVAILHVAYLWLPIGLALEALWQATGSELAAHWLHATTIGVLATMILAVMTRASLGHTGRALVVRAPIVLAYALLVAAALVRVFGPLATALPYGATIVTAGTLWIAAFGLFVWVYAPILCTPRIGD